MKELISSQNRTCRLDTIQKSGIDHVKELGRQNVKDLLATIEVRTIEFHCDRKEVDHDVSVE